VNLREYLAWPHRDRKAAATAKATSLLRMACERLRLVEPRRAPVTPPEPTVLVLGGGLAGLTAAGPWPTWVTPSTSWSGTRAWAASWPRSPSSPRRSTGARTSALAEETARDDRIVTHLGTTLARFSGHAGRFRAILDAADGPSEVACGALLLATGAVPHHPPSYLYGTARGSSTRWSSRASWAAPGRCPPRWPWSSAWRCATTTTVLQPRVLHRALRNALALLKRKPRRACSSCTATS